jgi:hypothetical protein
LAFVETNDPGVLLDIDKPTDLDDTVGGQQ